MRKEAIKALKGWHWEWLPRQKLESEDGFIEYVGDSYGRLHILTIYTTPESRRKGVALTYLERLQTGTKAKTILSWSSDRNAAAIRLHMKAGFHRQGRVLNYYPNGDGAILWRWTREEDPILQRLQDGNSLDKDRGR